MCAEVIRELYQEFQTDDVNKPESFKYQIDFKNPLLYDRNGTQWLVALCALKEDEKINLGKHLYLFYGYQTNTVFSAIGYEVGSPKLQMGIYLEPDVRSAAKYETYEARRNIWESTYIE